MTTQARINKTRRLITKLLLSGHRYSNKVVALRKQLTRLQRSQQGVWS